MTPVALSVATWNVHGFVGADGRRDPERVTRILRSLDADLIALQEVDTAAGQPDLFDALGPELGFQSIPGPTLARSDGRYGNLLLTRHAPRSVQRVDLSQPGVEPRGAIDVRVEVDGVTVRVVATHLGLARRERARQARHLCEWLDGAADDGLVVLLGDLNEWRRPLGRTGLAPLVARFALRSRQRTFPSRAPLLALDRVLVDRRDARLRPQVVRGAEARAASDHLPLRACIELDAA